MSSFAPAGSSFLRAERGTDARADSQRFARKRERDVRTNARARYDHTRAKRDADA